MSKQFKVAITGDSSPLSAVVTVFQGSDDPKRKPDVLGTMNLPADDGSTEIVFGLGEGQYATIS